MDATSAYLNAAPRSVSVVRATRAIRARRNGEWDQPDLVEFGPLTTNTDMDCAAIAEFYRGKE